MLYERMPYRIAVNTRLLLAGKLDGIGNFTYETLRRLVTKHPEHEFWFLFDRPFSKEFLFGPNVKPLVIPPPARHPVLWHIWFQWSLPLAIRRIKPHLFLSPDGFLPLRCSVPCIPVIHDLNFEHRPQDLPFLTRTFYHHFFPRFARKAARIVTVSEYSRTDISRTYTIPESKIDVCYNGASERFVPLPPDEQMRVRRTFTGGSPYFIMVGSLHPRKNIVTALKAFELYRRENPSGIKLVLAGPAWFGKKEIHHTWKKMQYRTDVIFTGRVPTETLHRLLASSLALVCISHFEGFGIPLLEAMHCDVPVIASRVTSLPEVAGDAALYVDPNDAASVARAMETLSNDDNIRQSLIEKGRLRRNVFSWDRTAGLLWQSMENVLRSNYDATAL